jgi:RHS repeat-associated protein
MPTQTRKTILLATDQQNSILVAHEENQTQHSIYPPFGHRALENGLLTLLGFNGELQDPMTRHYHLGNGYRAFNPVLMRFTRPDSWSPFGRGGLNTYAYCGGNPINRADKSGHAWYSIFTRLFSSSKKGPKIGAEFQRATIVKVKANAPRTPAGNLLDVTIGARDMQLNLETFTPKKIPDSQNVMKVADSGTTSATGSALQTSNNPIPAYKNNATAKHIKRKLKKLERSNYRIPENNAYHMQKGQYNRELKNLEIRSLTNSNTTLDYDDSSTAHLY